MDAHNFITRRWLTVLTVAATSATMAGFMVGTRREPEPAGYAAPRPERLQELEPAPTYRQLASGRESPNRKRQADNVAQLAAATAGPQAHDPSAWHANVKSRAERRAYDGAPPLIPHPVDQRALPNCSTCHEQHLRIGERVSPAPSHATMLSCTQCHVVATSPVPLMAALPAEPSEANTFAGLASAGLGKRAWPGAPPEIPHATHMRERCGSCHATFSGLHSSHTDRQSCTQCHAPSAQLDQHSEVSSLIGTP